MRRESIKSSCRTEYPQRPLVRELSKSLPHIIDGPLPTEDNSGELRVGCSGYPRDNTHPSHVSSLGLTVVIPCTVERDELTHSFQPA